MDLSWIPNMQFPPAPMDPRGNRARRAFEADLRRRFNETMPRCSHPVRWQRSSQAAIYGRVNTCGKCGQEWNS